VRSKYKEVAILVKATESAIKQIKEELSSIENLKEPFIRLYMSAG